MIIVGALLERTANGFKSGDDGCAIYKNGEFVFALPEERITRVKYAGGFVNSLMTGLTLNNLDINDVDAFVFASYGEEVADSYKHIIEQAPILQNISKEKFHIAPSHHYLHALQAFRFSKTNIQADSESFE